MFYDFCSNRRGSHPFVDIVVIARLSAAKRQDE